MDKKDFLSEEEYASQAGTGALLNPRMDSTFKALFTQKTEDSYEAMRSFLSAATERTVRSWQLTANDVPASFSGQRDVSYGFPMGSQRPSAEQKVACNVKCFVTCA